MKPFEMCCLKFLLDAADVAELLIKHGADMNARNEDGNTPLDLAIKFCKVLKMLHDIRLQFFDKNLSDYYSCR